MKKEKLKDPRRRKLLLVLPLLVIPFLTMAFWALGGGKEAAASNLNEATGLNLQLPGAQLKDDKGENKLSYYEQMEKDSVKWREGVQNDPFFSPVMHDSMPGKTMAFTPDPLQTADYKDPNEQKVYQKLAELNSHLQNPGNYSGNLNQDWRHSSNINPSITNEEVDRLEGMMKTVSSSPARDPEVEQLNGMMERILDIQHPQRVQQRLNGNTSNNKTQVFDAYRREDRFSIGLLDTGITNVVESNGFFGIDNKNRDQHEKAIEALIHETQSLMDGSIIKIRLLHDITVNDAVIPTGSFLFGRVSLEGERLHVEINSIRKDQSLYPVRMRVYDLDGMEGIHIPGAITREVAKQSADRSLQDIQIGSLDPSFKAQATTAGINAARTLLSRKVKLVKVTVKAGYKILLKEVK